MRRVGERLGVVVRLFEPPSLQVAGGKGCGKGNSNFRPCVLTAFWAVAGISVHFCLVMLLLVHAKPLVFARSETVFFWGGGQRFWFGHWEVGVRVGGWAMGL